MFKPIIVCLCGSTRFSAAYQEANLRETLAGHIVLTTVRVDPTERERLKAMLDKLHQCKIDLADEVLILNVDGYIGESTRKELDYARSQGKAVRFLEAGHA